MKVKGPFLVLLGDNILINEHLPPTTNKSRSNASLNLIKKFHENKRPVVGLHKVEKEELSSFGVVKKVNGKITEIMKNHLLKMHRVIAFYAEDIYLLKISKIYY